jgi:Uma2 family endonuclease
LTFLHVDVDFTADLPMSTVAHFTLAHYEHMVEVGSFSGPFRKRVELLRGEIVDMSPIGTEHAETIDRLMEWSISVTAKQAIRVRIQNPIRIPASDSEPEPDVAWVARKNYSDRHPEPQETLLIVEVADTSLAVDRGEKLSVYAEAGIGEYWIVNLLDRHIEVYRKPSGKTYQSSAICRGQDAVSPLALPSASLQPSHLFEG